MICRTRRIRDMFHKCCFCAPLLDILNFGVFSTWMYLCATLLPMYDSMSNTGLFVKSANKQTLRYHKLSTAIGCDWRGWWMEYYDFMMLAVQLKEWRRKMPWGILGRDFCLGNASIQCQLMRLWPCGWDSSESIILVQ